MQYRSATVGRPYNSAGLEHNEGDIVARYRALDGLPDTDDGGLTEGDIDPGHRLLDGFGVAHVALDNFCRVGQDETDEHTFETTGTYPYFCVPHESGMVGTVVVE